MSTREATAAREPIVNHLARVVDAARGLGGGHPHSIGPGTMDGCGAAICTVDGHVYAAGDSEVEFAIQSISKTFTYALALCDRGMAYLDSKIDVEPSGEAFNEISLDGDPSRPANPLVNVGSIAAAWCVSGDRFPRILDFYERLAGRALTVDEEIYHAETADSARNRALAWLLTAAGVIEENPVPALQTYLRQCSVRVTARDLAVMGATLANRGVQPRTGETVMPADVAQRVLSVMATCGMYDEAGAWMTRVGLPAKSGVGGGIVAAAAGQLGIGTFGPPLDHHGNSVRGTDICERLSDEFDLHFARVPRPHHATVRRIVDLTPRARLVELQGELGFLGIEAALQAVLTAAQNRPAVVVDLRLVTHLVTHARDLLHQAGARLAETGHQLLVVGDESMLGEATLCATVDEALARLADSEAPAAQRTGSRAP